MGAADRKKGSWDSLGYCLTGLLVVLLFTPPTQAGAPPELLFSTEEYFSTAEPDYTAHEIKLLDSDFEGLFIRTPQSVDVTERESLPLIIASRYNGERDWRLPIREHAVLIGIDLTDLQVHSTMLFSDLKRSDESLPSAEPMPEEQASFGAQLNRVDLRRLLDIPWQRGRWAFSVIYHDWISNRMVVRLTEQETNSGASLPTHWQPLSVTFELLSTQAGIAQLRVNYRLQAAGVQQPCRKEIAATLLLVSVNSTGFRRYDFSLPIESKNTEGSVQGFSSYDLALPSPLKVDELPYLIMGGQIFSQH